MKTVTLPDGREFCFQEYMPYTRKDGTTTSIEIWVSTCCRPGCTATFSVSVPIGTDPLFAKAFGSKHCADHKLTRAECLTRAFAARKIKRV